MSIAPEICERANGDCRGLDFLPNTLRLSLPYVMMWGLPFWFQNSFCFGAFLKKWAFLAVFLEFFRNGNLQIAEVYCVAFSTPGRFFLAIKINLPTNFQIFHHKGGGSHWPRVRHNFARSKIKNKNCLGIWRVMSKIKNINFLKNTRARLYNQTLEIKGDSYFDPAF